VIVLAGDRAYKVKKPVDLGFLDFRSSSARRTAIERELRLNRRIAPDVYLDAATLCGSDGAEIEHVLVMRRMPDDRRLSALVVDTAASPEDLRDCLRQVARLVADFHSRAARSPLISAETGAAGLRRRWADNLAETQRFAGGAIAEAAYQRIGRLAMDYVDGRGPLFERRAAAGVYVDGHGDITADDVFCLQDGPRLLDCLDFDDRLRWVDALDDAAFLAMELEHLGRADLGRFFLDQYAEYSATPTVASLEHHYLAYRAYVRAKVACLRADQGTVAAPEAITSYLDLALCHLEAGQVRLILVGGAPGTGKSTIAGMIADALGAVLLSTDTVRRHLGPTVEASYDVQTKRRVYRELLLRAAAALGNGETVVADATWGSEHLRELASQAAQLSHSTFVELECQAPVAVAAARAERRLRGGASASRAGGGVARMLATERDPWPSATTIDCSGSPLAALRAVGSVVPLPH
jgi:hypothetical protein